ncbi:hypothetical protein [Pontiella sulfatireligans]|uniref:Uncharacterized protein n=1 Tax=Pontiella sulfatireligans TaxID=2750658 RepID=A0A6C2UIU2_9BACT|nr:hypothetical protein [Pontiella sulfatireligans]VGO19879.1 hypothetical protein SCARR_01939 [Pontiella sulfatireligans]
MNPTTLILLLLCIALAGHYVSQKLLLKKGWESDDPKRIVNRLMMNGAVLIFIAIAALLMADPPYGLFGILIFIEGAVSVTFGRKLSKK